MYYPFILDFQVNIERSILSYHNKYDLFFFNMQKHNISGIYKGLLDIIEYYHDYISIVESQVNTKNSILSFLNA